MGPRQPPVSGWGYLIGEGGEVLSPLTMACANFHGFLKAFGVSGDNVAIGFGGDGVRLRVCDVRFR